MHFDLSTLSVRERYKLLTGVIVPRPIALVTSVGADGLVNAAPFSYFNVMGADPPVVVFGPGNRAPGQPKDTAQNVADTREFVVNLVDEALAEAMNLTATDFPPHVSEVEALGLETVPSVTVAPPRLAAAPVHLECKEVTTLTVGNTRVVAGEVLHLHIRDALVDAERMRIHGDRLHLVGRMHGAWYTRTRDLFEMPRLSYDAWLKDRPQAEVADPDATD
ncbi:MAG: flavin reductase family protein [Bacteroidota bacterium]